MPSSGVIAAFLRSIPSVYLWRLLALLWSAKIFMMSTAVFTSYHTKSMLAHLLEALGFAFSSDFLRLLNLCLRKFAHFLEYAALSFFLYRSFAEQNRLAWQSRHAAWVIVLATLYSLTDEFHQALVRGRTASLMDSAIDSMGALLAMGLIYRFTTRPHLDASVTTSRG